GNPDAQRLNSPTTTLAREMNMNRLDNLLRAVTCAMSATLITFVLGFGFVESTNAAPFHVAPAAAQATPSA
ncbi:MAG TPA: hypothetical protein VEY89_09865, partial [Candidatus Dormibacteraeota bacterium]|nr:hypothetical protein [Candidatus Dormibacteraeota bacterium]